MCLFMNCILTTWLQIGHEAVSETGPSSMTIGSSAVPVFGGGAWREGAMTEEGAGAGAASGSGLGCVAT